MGMKINQTKFNELKAIAEKCDVDKKNGLDEKELVIFNSEAKKAGFDENGAEMKKVMGLYVSKPTMQATKTSKTIDAFNKAYDTAFKQTAGKSISEMSADELKEAKYPNVDDILKQVKKELKKSDQYDKKAFKALEEKLYEDAQNLVHQTIIENRTQTNTNKLRKEVEAKLKANGQWSSFTNRALYHGRTFWQGLSGQDTLGKQYAADRAQANNVINHRYQTAAEIKKQVGEKIFEEMKKPHTGSRGVEYPALITEITEGDMKGMYDLSELQRVTAAMIGGNNKLDYGHRDPKSERLNTKAEFEIRMGLDKLSKGDRNDIVRLTGSKVDNGWGKLVLGTLFGAAAGAATGAGAGLAKPTQMVREGDAILNKNLNIEIKMDGDLGFIDSIINSNQDGAITKTATGFMINVEKFVKIPGMILALSKHIELSALYGAAPGAFVGLMNAINNLAEKPAFPENFKECTFEQYMEFIDKRYPDQAKQIERVAKEFVNPDGSWEADKFRQFINLVAGDKSSLNKGEMLSMERMIADGKLDGIFNDCGDAIVKPKKATKPEQTEQTEQTSNNGNDCDNEPCDVTSRMIDKQAGSINVKFTSWVGLVKGYYPNYAECGLTLIQAIHLLKEAAAYDANGNYDAAKHKRLIGNARTGQVEIPKDINLPEKLGDCLERTGAKSAQHKVTVAKHKSAGSCGKQTAPSETWEAQDCHNTARGGSDKEARANLKDPNKRTAIKK